VAPSHLVMAPAAGPSASDQTTEPSVAPVTTAVNVKDTPIARLTDDGAMEIATSEAGGATDGAPFDSFFPPHATSANAAHASR
jgi:hypothetical protein